MRRYWWLTLFALAMAYLETAVVVYLRELYYPEGFHFPLVIIPFSQALVEVGREVATVVMLVAVARLGARGRWENFAAFMFLFGAWDIFYYVWLKIILDWPASLLTWDVLFLIPVVWIGPVLAPLIISVSLIAAALAIEAVRARGWAIQARRWEWISAVAAGLTVILSFTWNLRVVINEEVPARFRWDIFFIGELGGVILFLRGLRRAHRLGRQAV